MLTHVVAHEGDADRYGVPGGPCVVTLDVPASAFVHKTVLSNEEAVEEGQSLMSVGGASPNISHLLQH